MDEYEDMGEPVLVVRDAGYSKLKTISPEYRRKARERMNNPNVPSGDWALKELLEDVGIVVNPEKMTRWYKYVEE